MTSGICHVAAAVIALALASAPAQARKWQPHAPTPRFGLPVVQGYLVGLPFCGAANAILATALAGRELKSSEAMAIFANCVLPFLGGRLVARLFSMHPGWDKMCLPWTWDDRYRPAVLGRMRCPPANVFVDKGNLGQ